MVFGAVALLLFLHRGDPEGSARVANRELDLLLERNEAVSLRIPVMRRHWWHFFRVTHGVLAMTDRRLLFVGVPPEALMPHEDEPLELEEESWRFDHAPELRRSRVFLETRPGFAITSDARRALYGIAPRDGARLDSLVSAVAARLTSLEANREAERRALTATAVAARRPIYHLVQPRETLEGIAMRYGVSVDSLREWNGITGQRILAGERLLVNPGR